MPQFKITRRRRTISHGLGASVGSRANCRNSARSFHNSPTLRQIRKVDGKRGLHIADEASSKCATGRVFAVQIREFARYSGLPTRKAGADCGVALRSHRPKLIAMAAPLSTLIRTRSYKSARHQERASAMSAAQSTSMPSLRMTSARNSRLRRKCRPEERVFS